MRQKKSKKIPYLVLIIFLFYNIIIVERIKPTVFFQPDITTKLRSYLEEYTLRGEEHSMFYLEKTIEISAAHKLKLDYDSKCQNLHGHNFQVTIFCKSKTLDKNGMVIDFNTIKDKIKILDHCDLNSLILQPTSENIAQYICELIPKCYKVKVVESKGNEVIYEED